MKPYAASKRAGVTLSSAAHSAESRTCSAPASMASHCGRMSRERPRSFVAKSGYFVLTQDETLSVGDRKVKEILFRKSFVAIRHVSRSTFGTLHLGIATDAGQFRFELPCDVVGRSVADEFERRILVRSQVIAMHPGPQYSCD